MSRWEMNEKRKIPRSRLLLNQTQSTTHSHIHRHYPYVYKTVGSLFAVRWSCFFFFFSSFLCVFVFFSFFGFLFGVEWCDKRVLAYSIRCMLSAAWHLYIQHPYISKHINAIYMHGQHEKRTQTNKRTIKTQKPFERHNNYWYLILNTFVYRPPSSKTPFHNWTKCEWGWWSYRILLIFNMIALWCIGHSYTRTHTWTNEPTAFRLTSTAHNNNKKLFHSLCLLAFAFIDFGFIKVIALTRAPARINFIIIICIW